jgi:hypothetical protein
MLKASCASDLSNITNFCKSGASHREPLFLFKVIQFLGLHLRKNDQHQYSHQINSLSSSHILYLRIILPAKDFAKVGSLIAIHNHLHYETSGCKLSIFQQSQYQQISQKPSLTTSSRTSKPAIPDNKCANHHQVRRSVKYPPLSRSCSTSNIHAEMTPSSSHPCRISSTKLIKEAGELRAPFSLLCISSSSLSQMYVSQTYTISLSWQPAPYSTDNSSP